MPRRIVPRLFWGLLLLGTAGVAWAQGPFSAVDDILRNPDGPASPLADSADAVLQIQALIDALTGAIDKLASPASAAGAQLRTLGQRIALALFGTTLAWGTIRSWVVGRGFAQLLPELIQPLVVLGLSLWAVENLAAGVRDSVLALGDLVAGSLSPTFLNETGVITSLGRTALELMLTQVGNGFHPFAWLAGKLECLFAAAMLMVAGVVGAGIMIVAKVQTALAMLLAPVLVPWAMWQASTFLFNTWLTFLITGAMTQALVKIMAAMSAQAVSGMTQVVDRLASHEVSLVVYAGIALSGLLIAYLFQSVPRLASGLVGGASIGIQGWLGPAAGALRIAQMGMNALSSLARTGLRAGAAGLAAAAARGQAAGGGASRAGLQAGWNRMNGGGAAGPAAGRAAGSSARGGSSGVTSLGRARGSATGSATGSASSSQAASASPASSANGPRDAANPADKGPAASTGNATKSAKAGNADAAGGSGASDGAGGPGR